MCVRVCPCLCHDFSFSPHNHTHDLHVTSDFRAHACQLSASSFDSWVAKPVLWNRHFHKKKKHMVGYSQLWWLSNAVATHSVKARLVKSAGCCLCSIDEDYRDKTLMPSDTFSYLNLLLNPQVFPPSQSPLSSPTLPLYTLTHQPAAMRTVLTLLLLISLSCHSEFCTILVQTLILGFTIYTLSVEKLNRRSYRWPSDSFSCSKQVRNCSKYIGCCVCSYVPIITNRVPLNPLWV